MLLSNTPKVSNQVKATVAIARPAKIVFAIKNSNDIRTNALTVITSYVSFGFYKNTEVA